MHTKLVSAEETEEARQIRSLQSRVAQADLEPFEKNAEAQRLERLEADEDLYVRLALLKFAGRDWEIFRTALTEYALPVVKAWVKSEKIFTLCLEKRIGLARENVTFSDDDALELGCETVANALNAFRAKVLIPGKWTSKHGATLKTFFIGQCIFQFPNVYRRWLGERGLALFDPSTMVVDLEFLARRASPEQLAEFSLAARTLTPGSTVWIRAVNEIGYTYEEIAEVLGTTAKAIESKVGRVNSKLKKRGQPTKKRP